MLLEQMAGMQLMDFIMELDMELELDQLVALVQLVQQDQQDQRVQQGLEEMQ
jgi:hypothetical protein